MENIPVHRILWELYTSRIINWDPPKRRCTELCFHRVLFGISSPHQFWDPIILTDSYFQLISSYDFEYETSGCERMVCFGISWYQLFSSFLMEANGRCWMCQKRVWYPNFWWIPFSIPFRDTRLQWQWLFFVTVSFTVTAHDSLFWLLSIMIFSYVIYVICRLFLGVG